jgi:hypothetical protein
MKYVMFCLFMLMTGCVSTPTPTPAPTLKVPTVKWAHTYPNPKDMDTHCPVSGLDEFHRKLLTQPK